MQLATRAAGVVCFGKQQRARGGAKEGMMRYLIAFALGLMMSCGEPPPVGKWQEPIAADCDFEHCCSQPPDPISGGGPPDIPWFAPCYKCINDPFEPLYWHCVDVGRGHDSDSLDHCDDRNPR